jgi:hypothetical protein
MLRLVLCSLAFVFAAATPIVAQELPTRLFDSHADSNVISSGTASYSFVTNGGDTDERTAHEEEWYGGFLNRGRQPARSTPILRLAAHDTPEFGQPP